MTAIAIRIHNSLTGEKQALQPIVPGKIGMYVCGMTVYDFIHIGHAPHAGGVRHSRAVPASSRLPGHLRSQHHRHRRQDHQRARRRTARASTP